MTANLFKKVKTEDRTFKIQKHNNITGVSAKQKNNSLYAALKANIVKVVNTPHARNLLDLQGSANCGGETPETRKTKQTKRVTQGPSLEFVFGCNFCPQTGS